MQIVVEYQWGDGYTCNGTQTLPFEYSSTEAFICDFEKELTKAIDEKKMHFNVANYEFDTSDHYWWDGKQKVLELPEVWTIDEWFVQKAAR